MKEIKLTQNQVTLVDDIDFEYLNQWKWCAVKRKNGGFYATRRITLWSNEEHKYQRNEGKRKYQIILMHVLLLNTPKDKDTDHRNGNSLDNQRHNLRICERWQNIANKSKTTKPTSSQYKGVSWNSSINKWIASIMKDCKAIHLGCFIDEEKAARIYDQAALEYFGEFAKLNFPA